MTGASPDWRPRMARGRESRSGGCTTPPWRSLSPRPAKSDPGLDVAVDRAPRAASAVVRALGGVRQGRAERSPRGRLRAHQASHCVGSPRTRGHERRDRARSIAPADRSNARARAKEGGHPEGYPVGSALVAGCRAGRSGCYWPRAAAPRLKQTSGSRDCIVDDADARSVEGGARLPRSFRTPDSWNSNSG